MTKLLSNQLKQYPAQYAIAMISKDKTINQSQYYKNIILKTVYNEHQNNIIDVTKQYKQNKKDNECKTPFQKAYEIYATNKQKQIQGINLTIYYLIQIYLNTPQVMLTEDWIFGFGHCIQYLSFQELKANSLALEILSEQIDKVEKDVIEPQCFDLIMNKICLVIKHFNENKKSNDIVQTHIYEICRQIQEKIVNLMVNKIIRIQSQQQIQQIFDDFLIIQDFNLANISNMFQLQQLTLQYYEKPLGSLYQKFQIYIFNHLQQLLTKIAKTNYEISTPNLQDANTIIQLVKYLFQSDKLYVSKQLIDLMIKIIVYLAPQYDQPSLSSLQTKMLSQTNDLARQIEITFFQYLQLVQCEETINDKESYIIVALGFLQQQLDQTQQIIITNLILQMMKIRQCLVCVTIEVLSKQIQLLQYLTNQYAITTGYKIIQYILVFIPMLQQDQSKNKDQFDTLETSVEQTQIYQCIDKIEIIQKQKVLDCVGVSCPLQYIFGFRYPHQLERKQYVILCDVFQQIFQNCSYNFKQISQYLLWFVKLSDFNGLCNTYIDTLEHLTNSQFLLGIQYGDQLIIVQNLFECLIKQYDPNTVSISLNLEEKLLSLLEKVFVITSNQVKQDIINMCLQYIKLNQYNQMNIVILLLTCLHLQTNNIKKLSYQVLQQLFDYILSQQRESLDHILTILLNNLLKNHQYSQNSRTIIDQFIQYVVDQNFNDKEFKIKSISIILQFLVSKESFTNQNINCILPLIQQDQHNLLLLDELFDNLQNCLQKYNGIDYQAVCDIYSNLIKQEQIKISQQQLLISYLDQYIEKQQMSKNVITLEIIYSLAQCINDNKNRLLCVNILRMYELSYNTLIRIQNLDDHLSEQLYVKILCKNKCQDEQFIQYLKENIAVLNPHIIMSSLEYEIENKLISAEQLCQIQEQNYQIDNSYQQFYLQNKQEVTELNATLIYRLINKIQTEQQILNNTQFLSVIYDYSLDKIDQVIYQTFASYFIIQILPRKQLNQHFRKSINNLRKYTELFDTYLEQIGIVNDFK